MRFGADATLAVAAAEAVMVVANRDENAAVLLC